MSTPDTLKHDIYSRGVFKGTDVCKFLAACLIVLLHATETTDFLACGIKFVCTRFAVPFFFMASGFFFAKGLETRRELQQWEYVKKYCFRLLLTYVVWALIIYLPFVIYNYFTLPKYADSSSLYVILAILRKLFIVGPGPYWYLVALLESIMVLYVLRKYVNCIVVLMILSFCLLLLYSCVRNYMPLILPLEIMCQGIDFLYSWEFNLLTYGIPFCSIGFLTYHCRWNLSTRYALFLFLFFTGIRIVEYMMVDPAETFSFFYIPQAICFFFFSLNFKVDITDSLSKTFRQLSSFIYFAHLILLYNVLNEILTACGFPYTYAPFAILPKTLLIILLCFFLFLMLRKRENAFCRILVNG